MLFVLACPAAVCLLSAFCNKYVGAYVRSMRTARFAYLVSGTGSAQAHVVHVLIISPHGSNCNSCWQCHDEPHFKHTPATTTSAHTLLLLVLVNLFVEQCCAVSTVTVVSLTAWAAKKWAQRFVMVVMISKTFGTRSASHQNSSSVHNLNCFVCPL